MTTRLLLVEDHQMTLLGLRMLLEREEDMEVLGEADNGVKAVEMASSLMPDMILMDIGLPEMDGIEATQKIKALHPAIKIIMLTSKDSESDVFAALAAGADAYCMKGINPAALNNALQSVKDGAAWLDPAIARIVLGRFQPGSGGFSQPASQTAEGKTAQVGLAEGVVVDCPLTAREMEVLRLIVDGHSNPEIAEKLVITKATAKAHVHSILQKLCVDDRTQAAVLAMRQGLV
jgi:DNA-binding NarL/FixJ family response regulator